MSHVRWRASGSKWGAQEGRREKQRRGKRGGLAANWTDPAGKLVWGFGFGGFVFSVAERWVPKPLLIFIRSRVVVVRWRGREDLDHGSRRVTIKGYGMR